MTIGEKVADLRKQHSLSQPQLADKMAVSQSTIAMWESNKRKINTDDLKSLAKFFNVSTDYLLGNSTNKEGEELTENQKLVAYSIDPEVSDEEREAIIEMVKIAKKFKRRI